MSETIDRSLSGGRTANDKVGQRGYSWDEHTFASRGSENDKLLRRETKIWSLGREFSNNNSTL